VATQSEPIESIRHVPEADSFNFQKSFETIKIAILFHRWIVIATMAGTLAVVIMYMMLFPPVYQASLTVLAESPEDSQRNEFYNHWNVFRKNTLNDESELLVSGLVVGELVDRYDLKFDDVYHTFFGHLGYLWVESSIGKAYRAVKRFIFPPAESPYQLTEEELERGKTIDSLKEGIILSPVPDTNLGVMVVRGPSPRVADMANELLRIFLDVRKERLSAEAERAYDAIEVEVNKARAELEKVERRIEKHYSDNNMLLAYEKDKVQVTNWMELEAQLIELESQKSSFEQTIASLDAQLANTDREIITGRVLRNNDAYDTIRAQIIQLSITMEQLRQRFRDDSPEIMEIREQIASLRNLLESESETVEAQRTSVVSDTYMNLLTRREQIVSELECLKAGLAVKRSEAARIGASLDGLPEKMRVTRQLEREFQILEKKYMALSDKLMIAAVSKATVRSAPPAIELVNGATYPEKPSFPNKKLFILGALVFGLVAGIFAAVVIDFIYGRVSRYRLSNLDAKTGPYAIVSSDSDFIRRLYGLAPAAGSQA
jgi:uncharacterized protein involved in exopolysaccharide biosynthesis